ncbi:mitochondrial carrier [Cordyceps militaris]|uniref:Mitochondrial carrier n=1 Tax=Cordyceps militaris TaxID=73501 RepID=A0A2H4SGM4_CORMI|nr:mitochondrial carrier [Cordyceps militaris]
MDVYVAGAFAAFTVDMLIYPFDTLKTRRQSQDYLKVYTQSGKNSALALRGLYQGIGSVVLATLPAAGVFFSTYELSKTAFAKSSLLPLPVVHSVASATAEAASCLVLTPAELVKQHAQMMRSQGGGGGQKAGSTSLKAFRALYQAGVGRRLFTGYTALLARNMPLTAMQFPIFEHLRSRLWATRPPRRERGQRQRILETGAIAGLSAAAAGGLAAFITTPSDVVKTRMMLLTGSSNGSEAFDKGGQGRMVAEQQPWRVAKQIYRERGTKGLFRGGGLRSAWTAVGSGLYLGTYDAAKLWLTGGEDGHANSP